MKLFESEKKLFESPKLYRGRVQGHVEQGELLKLQKSGHFTDESVRTTREQQSNEFTITVTSQTY